MKEDGGRAPAGDTVWLAPLLDRGRIVEAGQPPTPRAPWWQRGWQRSDSGWGRRSPL